MCVRWAFPGPCPELLELLGFRHFFCQAYGVAFEPEKLRAEIARVLHLADTSLQPPFLSSASATGPR